MYTFAPMPEKAAGIVLYRTVNNQLQVYLGHLGGPFFAKKDAGAWTIPKGLIEDGEEPYAAALREFAEETGFNLTVEKAIELTPVRFKSGKTVTAWAVEFTAEEFELKSNLFTIEWPKKSGQMHEFPELDKGAWFNIIEAKEKINANQLPLLEELEELINL